MEISQIVGPAQERSSKEHYHGVRELRPPLSMNDQRFIMALQAIETPPHQSGFL